MSVERCSGTTIPCYLGPEVLPAPKGHFLCLFSYSGGLKSANQFLALAWVSQTVHGLHVWPIEGTDTPTALNEGIHTPRSATEAGYLAVVRDASDRRVETSAGPNPSHPSSPPFPATKHNAIGP